MNLGFGFYNMDCMDGMKQFEDKYFDIAIVDPPYGIGVGSMAYTQNKQRIYGQSKALPRDYSGHELWDKERPSAEYFEELFRVSKRQIIWGGNYFADLLPPSKGFICWDKRVYNNMSNDFADCEYAYLSDNMGVARMFRFVWNGMLQGNMKDKEERIHPTQKPVALYDWIAEKYCKKGYKILDTHVGSASSLIAYARRKLDFVGFEIDKEYFMKAKERFEIETAQRNIFDYI